MARKRLFTVLGKERVEQPEPGEARGTEESLLPPENTSFFASERKGEKGGPAENGFPFFLLRARDFTIYPCHQASQTETDTCVFLRGTKVTDEGRKLTWLLER